MATKTSFVPSLSCVALVSLIMKFAPLPLDGPAVGLIGPPAFTIDLDLRLYMLLASCRYMFESLRPLKAY